MKGEWRRYSPEIFFAAVSGLAIGATFSPHGGPVLPFLAFAPLAAALARTARSAAAPPLAPFAQGFAAAVVAQGIGLYWMVPSLSWRTSLAVPTYLLVLVLIGMVAGAACGAAAFLHGRKGWPIPLALAACWTGFEWAAARVPGVPYAWLNAGSSLAWHPALAAGAELFGARFLTFWTVAAGAFAAGVLAPSSAGGRGVSLRRFSVTPRMSLTPRITLLPRMSLPLLLLAFPAVAGYIRQAGLEDSEVVARVAVVQPGRSDGDLDGWLEPLRERRAAQTFAAAVFPERFLGLPGAGLPGTGLADFAAALGADVLVGTLDAEAVRGGADTLWYNAAFVQPPGEPRPPPYRKTRLVPGLETAGAWPAGSRSLPSRGYVAGRDPEPLVVDGRPVGVMICYDSAFEANARALVRAGADWLAVISNDDWLDPARPFRTTWAYWQHATHARLRAIENRVSVIQAGATGYSFAVSPAGRGAPFALEPGAEGVAVLTASSGHGPTVFTRMGDLLGLACFAVFAAAAAAAASLTARSRQDNHATMTQAGLPTDRGRALVGS